jgi:hypothetical protein
MNLVKKLKPLKYIAAGTGVSELGVSIDKYYSPYVLNMYEKILEPINTESIQSGLEFIAHIPGTAITAGGIVLGMKGMKKIAKQSKKYIKSNSTIINALYK